MYIARNVFKSSKYDCVSICGYAEDLILHVGKSNSLRVVEKLSGFLVRHPMGGGEYLFVFRMEVGIVVFFDDFQGCWVEALKTITV